MASSPTDEQRSVHINHVNERLLLWLAFFHSIHPPDDALVKDVRHRWWDYYL